MEIYLSRSTGGCAGHARVVSNPAHDPGFGDSKRRHWRSSCARNFQVRTERRLQATRFYSAYAEYYRQFKKTYHIQLQLESIVLKEKSIPSVAALVEAMFMAEMQDLLLTVGHDLDTVHLPLTLDVATGDETYTLLRGEEQILKPGDMMIRDQVGVISSILYGPDQRTQITPATSNVIFTVYAPPGIKRSRSWDTCSTSKRT